MNWFFMPEENANPAKTRGINQNTGDISQSGIQGVKMWVDSYEVTVRQGTRYFTITKYENEERGIISDASWHLENNQPEGIDVSVMMDALERLSEAVK